MMGEQVKGKFVDMKSLIGSGVKAHGAIRQKVAHHAMTVAQERQEHRRKLKADQGLMANVEKGVRK